MHLLSHTTCGPGLRLLSALRLAICVLHVCCTPVLFGTLVRLLVSLAQSACGTERQNPHVTEKRVPPACSLQLIAAYRACSGGSVTRKALRMVSIHWPKAFHALDSALPPPSKMTHPGGMKVSPRTGFIRNLANFPYSVSWSTLPAEAQY